MPVRARTLDPPVYLAEPLQGCCRAAKHGSARSRALPAVAAAALIAVTSMGLPAPAFVCRTCTQIARCAHFSRTRRCHLGTWCTQVPLLRTSFSAHRADLHAACRAFRGSAQLLPPASACRASRRLRASHAFWMPALPLWSLRSVHRFCTPRFTACTSACVISAVYCSIVLHTYGCGFLHRALQAVCAPAAFTDYLTCVAAAGQLPLLPAAACRNINYRLPFLPFSASLTSRTAVACLCRTCVLRKYLTGSPSLRFRSGCASNTADACRGVHRAVLTHASPPRVLQRRTSSRRAACRSACRTHLLYLRVQRCHSRANSAHMPFSPLMVCASMDSLVRLPFYGTPACGTLPPACAAALTARLLGLRARTQREHCLRVTVRLPAATRLNPAFPACCTRLLCRWVDFSAPLRPALGSALPPPHHANYHTHLCLLPHLCV